MPAVRPVAPKRSRVRACEWGPVTSDQCREVRRTQSPLWAKGFQLTPASAGSRLLLPSPSCSLQRYSPPHLGFLFCSFCCLLVTYADIPIIPPRLLDWKVPLLLLLKPSFQASCCRLLLTAYAAVRGLHFHPSYNCLVLELYCGLSLSP